MDKDLKAFLRIGRRPTRYRPVDERLDDSKEVSIIPPETAAKKQASRCMDCATPFCHWACPLGNYIPEWNDLASRGKWLEAYKLLIKANNFPEITARLCPALCEYSCVLNINDAAVTIRENELAISEYALRENVITARLPLRRQNKRIAIVGSGPAGLATAAQLNRAGYRVVVFERDKKVGGILRYGIPDFKLEKSLVDRRVAVMKKTGIIFETLADVGNGYPAKRIIKDFDAVIIAIGSRQPRDLEIEGRNLSGVHFAMDYLIQNNRRIDGETIGKHEAIYASNKRVVVIGGGDTGADCVGVARRQGARSVIQIEIMPKPAKERTGQYPWPTYPVLLRMSSSHSEGVKRRWSVLTKKFVGRGSKLKRLVCSEVELSSNGMKEIPRSEFKIDADLAILATGFLHPQHQGLVYDLSLDLDPRGNIKTNPNFASSRKGVFVAGDARRGQSLIVWAISEGRTVAHHVDTYLQGKRSNLPPF
ncbi:MAG: glutamate synthase subunit beta [Candidatus Omnitrophota bacterium]